MATAFEMGWSQPINGDLLIRPEDQFDVFVTTDKNLRYQQDLSGRNLTIVVLPFASWPRLLTRLAAIVEAINSLQAGAYIELP